MKCFLISLLLISFDARGQLRLAKIFTDNMVLQRDRPVSIRGKAMPGKKVYVSFSGEQKITEVKKDSSWALSFKKQKADPSPRSLLVICDNDTIKIGNILIGDIWLCLGQSNMQWPMQREKHFLNEISRARQPLLRFYNPVYAGEDIYNRPFSDSVIRRLNTNDFYSGAWQQSDSNSFKTMSAVGYYFGKAIAAGENIPVGLIDLAIGGAPIETFISKEALQKDPRFAGKLKGNWLNNERLPAWVRERGKQNAGNLQTDETGPDHGFKPGFAFASGIEPVISVPVKGIIWYQGESNAEEMERVNEYGELMKLMIAGYREQWKQPQMPFYWVQLSSIERPLWPQFRDGQRKLLDEIRNGGMAVCSDIGDKTDVHPTNKKEVGERLARWALNKTYKKNIVPSGPLPVQATYSHGKIEIRFLYAQGLRTSDDSAVKGFSLDGLNDVPVVIDKDRIEIISAYKPAFIYYGWKPFTDANLVNAEKLPASTFKIKVR